MGVHSRNFGDQFWQIIRSRKSQLSKNPLFLLEQKYRAWALMGLALIFAIVAYQVTQKEAQSDWLLAHKPSFVVWEDYLIRKGYVRVLDSDSLETILQSLPFSSSVRASRVFITENSRVFVVLEPEEKRVYSLGKGLPEKIPSPSWEPLGLGWQAFQSLTERTIPILDSSPSLKKQSRYKDLREISY
jgi:hypothetical protein